MKLMIHWNKTHCDQEKEISSIHKKQLLKQDQEGYTRYPTDMATIKECDSSNCDKIVYKKHNREIYTSTYLWHLSTLKFYLLSPMVHHSSQHKKLCLTQWLPKIMKWQEQILVHVGKDTKVQQIMRMPCVHM